MVRAAGRAVQGELPGNLDELSGTAEATQCFTNDVLSPGDVLYMNCQGGGGYGDPILRDVAMVAQDFSDGLLTAKAAKDIYGVVLSDHGMVDSAESTALRAEIRQARLSDMVIGPMLDGREDAAKGRPIDDNLTFVSDDHGSKICCRHCGQTLSDHDNVLHVGLIKGESHLAGPIVRTDPQHFLSEPVAFFQHVCPGCGTAVQTSIAPTNSKPTVSGFAVA